MKHIAICRIFVMLLLITNTIVYAQDDPAEEKPSAERTKAEAANNKTNSGLSTTKLASGEIAQQASDNSEGAKKAALGDVSVNLQSGQAQVVLNEPSGAELGISFSTGTYYAYQPDNTPFKLPKGLLLSNVPYLYKRDSQDVLSIQGAEYYIDQSYSSAVACDDGKPLNDDSKEHCDYKSGLKYQTSKNIKFKKTSPSRLTIHEKDGATSTVSFNYTLSYGNGAVYYFNAYGLCVLAANKYFENNAANNYKSVTRLEYKFEDEGAIGNELKRIVFANNDELKFSYQNGYLRSITYPKNASGKQNKLDIRTNTGIIERITAIFDGQYDYGYEFDLSDTKFIVTQGIYPQNQVEIVPHVVYEFKMEPDTNNIKRVNRQVTEYSIPRQGAFDVKKLQLNYQYDIPNQQYQYGSDTSLDTASNKDLNKEYSSTLVYMQGKKMYTRHVYNKFQQEIRTETFLAGSSSDLDERTLISVTYNKYNGVIGSDQSGDHQLVASYNMPIANYTVVFNEKGESVAVRASDVEYDNYAQIIKQIYYAALPYVMADIAKAPKSDLFDKGAIEAIIENIYDYRYLMQTRSITTDCSQGPGYKDNDCDKARVKTEKKTLTDDARNVAQEYTEFQDLKSGAEIAYSPVTSYEYASNESSCHYDDNHFYAGLVCSETTRLSEHDIASSQIPWQLKNAYSYSRADKDGMMQLATTLSVSALDYPAVQGNFIESNQKSVTVNSQNISTTDHFKTLLAGSQEPVQTSLETQVKYNAAGFPIEELAENGTKMVTEYDPVNLTIFKTMINENGGKLPVSKTQYDPLGNILESYEYSVGNKKLPGSKNAEGANNPFSTFMVEKNEYDYSYSVPLLVKSYDTYLNLTEYAYDDQGRLKSVKYSKNLSAADSKQQQDASGTSHKLIENKEQSYDLACGDELGCYQKLTTTNKLTGLTNLVYAIGQGGDDGGINLYSENSLNGRRLNSVNNSYTRGYRLLETEKHTYGESGANKRLISRTEYIYDIYGRLKTQKMAAFNTDSPSQPPVESYLHHHYDAWNKTQERYNILTPNKNYDTAKNSSENTQLKDYIKTYDILGRQISLSYQLGEKEHDNRNDYDGIGRVIRSQDFMGNLGDNFYNRKGVLDQSSYKPPTDVDRSSQVSGSQKISYVYDEFSRLEKNSLSINAQSIGDVIYHYDRLSFPQGYEFSGDYAVDVPKYDPDSIKRDEYNRVIEYTDKNKLTFITTYKPDGMVDKVTVQDQNSVKIGRQETTYYEYDPSNGLHQGKTRSNTLEFSANGKTQKQEVTYEYNELALPKTVTTVNLVDKDQNTSVVEYAYDNQQRIKQLTYSNSGAFSGNDLNMNKIVEYQYDSLNRIIEASTTFGQADVTENIVYHYDGIIGDIKKKVATQTIGNKKNVVTTEYEYNAIRQLLEMTITQSVSIGEDTETTTETHQYMYDLNGNLISDTIVDGGTTKPIAEYRYNALNQMALYIKYKDGAEENRYVYGYYPGGHRAFKTSKNQSVAFIYNASNDLQNEALIQNSGPQLDKLSSYVGAFRYISDKAVPESQVQMNVSDLMNTPLTLKSLATGVHSESYSISPYGQLWDVSAQDGVGELPDTTVAKSDDFDFDRNPFIYASGYYDSESGLQFMKSRYYSAGIERFMSQDTYDVLNRYNYANANPIIYYDPDGHMPLWLQFTFDLVSSVGEITAGALLGSPSLVMMGVGDTISAGFDIADIAQKGWSYDNGKSVGGYWFKKGATAAVNAVTSSASSAISDAAKSTLTVSENASGLARAGARAARIGIDATVEAALAPVNELPDILEKSIFESEGYDSGAMFGNMAMSAITSVIGSTIDLGLEKTGFDKVLTTEPYYEKMYGDYEASLKAFETTGGHQPKITALRANEFADYMTEGYEEFFDVSTIGELKKDISRDYKNIMMRKKLNGLPSVLINTIVVQTSDYVVESTTGTGWQDRITNPLHL